MPVSHSVRLFAGAATAPKPTLGTESPRPLAGDVGETTKANDWPWTRYQRKFGLLLNAKGMSPDIVYEGTDAPQYQLNPLAYLVNEYREGPNDRRCYVMARALQLAGYPAAGLVLSQLAYWAGWHDDLRKKREILQYRVPRGRHWLDSQKQVWVQLDRYELGATLGLSYKQVCRAIDKFEQQGLLQLYRLQPADAVSLVPDLSGQVFLLTGEAATLIDAKSALGVTVHLKTLRLCQFHIPAALVFSKLCYWYSPDKTKRCRLRLYAPADGQPWVVKTIEQMAAETGLTEKQVRDGIAKLKQAGFIVTRVKMQGRNRALQLSIDCERVIDAWQALTELAERSEEMVGRERASRR